jgi:hydrogenase/urease accessory protein HupE
MRWRLSLFCLCVAARAAAHGTDYTGLRIVLKENGTSVAVSVHDHLLPTGDAVTEVAARLKLRLNGVPFTAAKAAAVHDTANRRWIWQAESPVAVSSLKVERPLFPEVEGEKTILTVIRDGVQVGGAALTKDSPAFLLEEGHSSQGWWGDFTRFIREGIHHIFLGPDHIAFIVGLLLLGGSLIMLLKVVTAFTLAHSITLSLAAVGTLSLSPRIVEPVIALSIVVVAALNLRPAEERSDVRPLLAFGFGLIHGFGFAGALSEVGLPASTLGWSLAGFNLGVELGQAVIVLLLSPVLALLSRKRETLHAKVVLVSSLAIAAMGGWWFVERVFLQAGGR